MTPALLTPMALAALAALVIPLVIHIARRTESRIAVTSVSETSERSPATAASAPR